MSAESNQSKDASQVARELASRLDALGCEYSIGGAIALEQVLQLQGDQLDCAWVNDQLREIYGSGDPRVAQWQELVQEVRGG